MDLSRSLTWTLPAKRRELDLVGREKTRSLQYSFPRGRSGLAMIHAAPVSPPAQL